MEEWLRAIIKRFKVKIEKIWEEYQKGIQLFLKSKLSDQSSVDGLAQEIWGESIEEYSYFKI